jgi:DnaJ-class molecular chaperone
MPGLGRSGTDLLVDVAIEEHPYLHTDIVDPYDLVTTAFVSFYDYLYGQTYHVPFFGRTLTIEYTPGQTVCELDDHGLPFYESYEDPSLDALDGLERIRHGKLIVLFKVTIPPVPLRAQLDNPLMRVIMRKLFPSSEESNIYHQHY